MTLVTGPHDVTGATAVKDSFAELDPAGFDLLLDGRWLAHPAAPAAGGWRRVTDADGLAAWARLTDDPLPVDVLPRLAGHPDVAFLLTDGGAACTAFRSHGVVGVTNVVGPAWTTLPGAVASAFPGLPLVGYEAGDDLAAAADAGWTARGPVRVWLAGA